MPDYTATATSLNCSIDRLNTPVTNQTLTFLSRRFLHYQAMPDYTATATSLGVLNDSIDRLNTPTTGIVDRLKAALVDTEARLNEIPTGVDKIKASVTELQTEVTSLTCM
jgi:hypothetical protein